MDCNEATALRDAYLDGELDLVKALEIERHVSNCTDCPRRYTESRSLRAALRDAAPALYYPAPARLERQIRASLGRAEEGGGYRAAVFAPWWRRGAGIPAVAAVLFAALGLLLAWPGERSVSPEEVLVQAAVAGHDRSLITEHLMDVISTDQHTVKPWFNGRLDFSPPVTDLKEQGFPLVGGRVDELADRPVAALVYRRHKHVINLFVWPAAPGAALPDGTAARRGYHIVHWTQAGMACWAVSDLNGAELSDFARRIRAASP